MRMGFDIDFFNKLDFTGSVVKVFHDLGNDVWFRGDFAVGDIPYFSFTFKNCEQKRGEFRTEKIEGSKMTRFEITDGDLYGISVSFDCGITLEFKCRWIYRSLEMYKDKSYKNVYPEWTKHLENIAYVENAEYFRDEENIDISEGYSLNVRTYADMDDRAIKASLDVCELTRSGEHVFGYKCTYDHPCACKGLVRHSNGRTYLPFQVDLYGISYLDLDSGEVYNYIPEGYPHDIDSYCGESFIVTDIHYDLRSDIIAYGGCYWGGPYDIMAGDFSDPLNFDPHLVSVCSVIDPENDECWDVDFVCFKDGKLVVKTDDSREFSVDIEELKTRIKSF